MFSCCRKDIRGSEHEVNNEIHYTYTSAPDYEQSRLKLLQDIEKYNQDFNYPRLHDKGTVYLLDYNTLMKSDDPYLIKRIVVENLRDNLIKVDQKLIVALESSCQLVMLLKKCQEIIPPETKSE